MKERFGLWVSTHPLTTWVIRHVATHLDPWLFKKTNGRFTSMGVPWMPMLTLTMKGRKTGRPRAVHLACIEHAGERLVVASAMGQQRHPAWRYNLEANPEVEVQMPGKRYRARAEVLTDAEKEVVWPVIRATIPQIGIYEQRTDRNIRVFRLIEVERTQACAVSTDSRPAGVAPSRTPHEAAESIEPVARGSRMRRASRAG